MNEIAQRDQNLAKLTNVIRKQRNSAAGKLNDLGGEQEDSATTQLHKLRREFAKIQQRNIDQKYELKRLSEAGQRIDALELKLQDKSMQYNRHLKILGKKFSELEKENKCLKSSLAEYDSRKGVLETQNAEPDSNIGSENIPLNPQDLKLDIQKLSITEKNNKTTQCDSDSSCYKTKITPYLHLHKYSPTSALMTFPNGFKLMKYSNKEFELSSPFFNRKWKNKNVSTTFHLSKLSHKVNEILTVDDCYIIHNDAHKILFIGHWDPQKHFVEL